MKIINKDPKIQEHLIKNSKADPYLVQQNTKKGELSLIKKK
jgi:hypothetical protein